MGRPARDRLSRWHLHRRRGRDLVSGPASDRFMRVRVGGEVTDIVETRGRHAIACALGGDAGGTLFCCTSTTVGEPDKSRATRGAQIETVVVPVAART